jgi:hypothetical protein
LQQVFDAGKIGMFQALRHASFAIWGNFGHCPFCMRKAFQAASAAWAALVIVAIFLDIPLLLAAIAVGAVGLTSLWLTHIIAFARKISFAFKRPAHGRYGARSGLARSLAVAAALSAVPRRISVHKIYEYFGLGR